MLGKLPCIFLDDYFRSALEHTGIPTLHCKVYYTLVFMSQNKNCRLPVIAKTIVTKGDVSGCFLACCVLIRKHYCVLLDDKLKLDQALIIVNNYLPDQISAFYISEACYKVSSK